VTNLEQEAVSNDHDDETHVSVPVDTVSPHLGVSTGEWNLFDKVSSRHDFLMHVTLVEALDDPDVIEDSQDSYMLSTSDSLLDLDVPPVGPEIDLEPADETIDRHESLISYKYYSPPSTYIHSSLSLNYTSTYPHPLILHPLILIP
jgi:hypothetical protein